MVFRNDLALGGRVCQSNTCHLWLCYAISEGFRGVASGVRRLKSRICSLLGKRSSWGDHQNFSKRECAPYLSDLCFCVEL